VSYVAAGTCTLIAHVGVGTIYSAADGSRLSFTIVKIVLFVVPDTKSVTYGAAAPAYTFTYHTSSATGTLVTPVVGTAPRCSSTYTPTTSPRVSPVVITCTGGSDTRYTFNTSTTAALTITWGNITPLTVTFDTTTAVLTNATKEALTSFATTILASNYRTITIIANTPRTPTPTDITIANRRALAIATYLTSIFKTHTTPTITILLTPPTPNTTTNTTLNHTATINPTR
jgi:outer membrane protein OmpA-like peptidoglycan-associated protein